MAVAALVMMPVARVWCHRTSQSISSDACDCTESVVYFSYLHCALGTGVVLLTMPRKEALGTECLRRLLRRLHMSRNPYNWEELEG